MTFDEYKEEILNGEKMEWYDTMVPRKLVTPRVSAIANMIVENLHKMESELSDMRNGTKEKIKKQNYVDSVWLNVRHLPYTTNGLISDCYMKKYKRIIAEAQEKEVKKPKKRKTRKPKVSTTTKPKKDTSNKVEEKEPTPVVKGRRGKNSKLIFGK
jgi:hypothetical protein